jgi:WD40 repeat protein
MQSFRRSGVSRARANEGTLISGLFDGHTYLITLAVFSPNGARVTTGSDDQTVHLWSAHDGTLVAHPFEGRDGSLGYSLDNGRIISGCSGRII